ncbi:AAA family ATPase [Beduini massiliensis]|uniref:AAA family ATPase n=1 Tax=Beduini massiliensis TaxID=1585974 RepID=UPI000694B4B8|nr:ATP-dependent Clp protease ATP-binding subunit [Beduini massiliensis]
MLTKFSEKAQKIIVIAESVAFDLGHANVGSEHLLLSIMKMKDNAMYPLLEKYQITEQKLQDDIIRLFGTNDMQPFYMEYTNIVRVILDKAIKESHQRGEKKVSVECLCLGLLSIEDSVAIELLKKYDVDIEEVKEELEEMTKTENELDQINELININKRVKAQNTIVIGRDKELHQLIEVLSRKEKNNAIIVGKAGVGKTALVEKLAIEINNGNVPESLKECTLYELDLVSVVAGTKYRGEFEEKFKKIIRKVCNDPHCIIFIDEIHNIIGAGGAEGAIDASNIIKPYIARRQFTCIGATTQDEYYKYFEKDEALNRRFQYVHLDPTTITETTAIIEGLKESFEKFHQVKLEDSLIPYLVENASRHFHNRFMPDSAIDLLDLILVRAKMNKSESIDKRDVDKMVEELTNMKAHSNRLQYLKGQLLRYIKGQDEAIETIIQQLSLVESGLYEDGQPKWVSLFVGPTGVGKTEIAKLLAKYYLDDEHHFIKLDMSEYKESSSVSKIIGASPGYIGYDEQSLLVKHMSSHPRSVILLDEIEKAHRDVLNLFLSVFDEGVLKDQRGKTIDFKECIIIMTSNAGCDALKDSIGFKKDQKKNNVIDSIFPKEWLNRIDQVIYFDPISEEAARQIADMQIETYNKQLNMDIRYESNKLNELLPKEEIQKYGARAIKRAVKQYMYKQILNNTHV